MRTTETLGAANVLDVLDAFGADRNILRLLLTAFDVEKIKAFVSA